MQHDETLRFIDEKMRPRWPHWEPTAVQITDWVSWLRSYSWDTADAAIRRYVSDAKYGREPDPGRLVATLRAFGPAVKDTRGDDPNPAATVRKTWIMYAGGGKGRVGPGYFTEAPRTPEARAKLIERLKNLYTGGEGDWRIIPNATAWEMVSVRCEMSGAKPLLPSENWRDYVERIGTIPQPKAANEQVRELLASERKESTCA